MRGKWGRWGGSWGMGLGIINGVGRVGKIWGWLMG